MCPSNNVIFQWIGKIQTEDYDYKFTLFHSLPIWKSRESVRAMAGTVG